MVRGWYESRGEVAKYISSSIYGHMSGLAPHTVALCGLLVGIELIAQAQALSLGRVRERVKQRGAEE